MSESDKSPPKRPLLEIIAIICTKLAQGESEDQIRRFLDPDNECAVDFISFYVEFALEKNWLVEEEEEDKYVITESGKGFITLFLPKDAF
jgi:hypothetical protein